MESYRTRPAIFQKYSISRLTCSDWVSSKTQIVRAFRMKFWSPFRCFQPIPMEDQTTLLSYVNFVPPAREKNAPS